MTAAAGVTGLRAWVQNRAWPWLTPTRRRRATIAAFVVAVLVSSVSLSGSTRAPSTVEHRQVDVSQPVGVGHEVQRDDATAADRERAH